MRPTRRGVLFSMAVATACGGDEAGTSDASATTSATSTAETSVTSSASGSDTAGSSGADTGSSGGSSSTGTAADGSTGGEDLPCGDALVCTAGDVCIEDVIAPVCTNLEDPRGMCPPGQRMTFCGGAGIPCCCDPPPPSEFRCVAPVECSGAVDCACLGDVCTQGRQCEAQGSDPAHRFRCEEPPLP